MSGFVLICPDFLENQYKIRTNPDKRLWVDLAPPRRSNRYQTLYPDSVRWRKVVGNLNAAITMVWAALTPPSPLYPGVDAVRIA